MLILFIPLIEIAVDLIFLCIKALLEGLLLPFLLLWNWDIFLQFLETKVDSLTPLPLPLASLCTHILIGSRTITTFNLRCFDFSWRLWCVLLSFLYKQHRTWSVKNVKKQTHHILNSLLTEIHTVNRVTWSKVRRLQNWGQKAKPNLRYSSSELPCL
jgi:hypothetical protein